MSITDLVHRLEINLRVCLSQIMSLAATED